MVAIRRCSCGWLIRDLAALRMVGWQKNVDGEPELAIMNCPRCHTSMSFTESEYDAAFGEAMAESDDTVWGVLEDLRSKTGG